MELSFSPLIDYFNLPLGFSHTEGGKDFSFSRKKRGGWWVNFFSERDPSFFFLSKVKEGRDFPGRICGMDTILFFSEKKLYPLTLGDIWYPYLPREVVFSPPPDGIACVRGSPLSS